MLASIRSLQRRPGALVDMTPQKRLQPAPAIPTVWITPPAEEPPAARSLFSGLLLCGCSAGAETEGEKFLKTMRDTRKRFAPF